MNNVTYNFDGQNFCVTGASSGIGKQVVIDLANAGANILAIARRVDLLNELTENYPNQIYPAAVNVTDYESVALTVKGFVAEYGKLDGCVHAAGHTEFTPINSYEDEIAKDIMNVNFWGGMNLIKEVSKKKNSQNGASFVLISSIAGYCGNKGAFAYSATKAALRIACKAIAKEVVVKQQRINTISPAWVITPMTQRSDSEREQKMLKHYPLGFGMPEDVSNLALFLLSNNAKWITGKDFIIDGGLY